MERKLRRKFIGFSLTAYLIVFILIASSILITNYMKVNERAENIAKIIIENDGVIPKAQYPRRDTNIWKAPEESDKSQVSEDAAAELNASPEDINKRIEKEALFAARFFTVKLSEELQVKEINIGNTAAINIDDARGYADEVVKDGKLLKKEGITDNYKYFAGDTSNGKIIVFIDCGKELQDFYFLVRTAGIVGIISVLGVLSVAGVLSKRAVAPIVKAYDKQKQFIIDISHELKTPLSIISANNDITVMEKGETGWTKSTSNQIARLNNLIDMLITLAKLEEKEDDKNKVEFSLNRQIDDVVTGFKSMLTNRGLKIEKYLNEDIVLAGNPYDFKKMLEIVVENATKYSIENSTVSISVKGEGDEVLIGIRNLAEGLEKKDYNDIFERFYRLESSRNSETGGYGIGLAVAKAIAENHRGNITAKSPDGKQMVIEIKMKT